MYLTKAIQLLKPILICGWIFEECYNSLSIMRITYTRRGGIKMESLIKDVVNDEELELDVQYSWCIGVILCGSDNTKK